MLVKVTTAVKRKIKEFTKIGNVNHSYGDLERGNRDIKLSKLEQISDLLDIDLSSLFSSEKSIFNLSTGHSHQHNNNSCTITSAEVENLELKHALETQQILNTEKDKEIVLLKRIIELIEAKAAKA